MFYMLKARKYTLPPFQKKTQIIKKQVLLPSVNDSKRWRMALPCSKKLSGLLRGILSKHGCDFYCLNCLHSFRANNKLRSYKKVCERKIFCNVALPSENTKILELINTKNMIKHHLVFMHILNLW